MFVLKYRCKFRDFWYEQEFSTYAEAIEAGRQSVIRRGTPAQVWNQHGDMVWSKEP